MQFKDYINLLTLSGELGKTLSWLSDLNENEWTKLLYYAADHDKNDPWPLVEKLRSLGYKNSDILPAAVHASICNDTDKIDYRTINSVLEDFKYAKPFSEFGSNVESYSWDTLVINEIEWKLRSYDYFVDIEHDLRFVDAQRFLAVVFTNGEYARDCVDYAHLLVSESQFPRYTIYFNSTLGMPPAWVMSRKRRMSPGQWVSSNDFERYDTISNMTVLDRFSSMDQTMEYVRLAKFQDYDIVMPLTKKIHRDKLQKVKEITLNIKEMLSKKKSNTRPNLGIKAMAVCDFSDIVVIGQDGEVLYKLDDNKVLDAGRVREIALEQLKENPNSMCIVHPMYYRDPKLWGRTLDFSMKYREKKKLYIKVLLSKVGICLDKDEEEQWW